MTKDNEKATLAEHNVKVGDVVQWNGGLLYTVQDGGLLMSNDTGKTTNYKSWWDISIQFTVVSRANANIIVAGNTYTTYNEGEWYCIYTTDEHAYMIADEGATAYVWDLDGMSCSLGNDYDVDWGPITKEGVSIDRGVLTIGGLDWFVEGVITTVDGVPDWHTLSVSSYAHRQPTSAKEED